MSCLPYKAEIFSRKDAEAQRKKFQDALMRCAFCYCEPCKYCRSGFSRDGGAVFIAAEAAPTGAR